MVIGAGCLPKNIKISGSRFQGERNDLPLIVIGENCLIQSSTGDGDGFGYANDRGNCKIPQSAGSLLAIVEIGASTTIDRGALDDTAGNGVIIDNQCQIAI